MDSHVIGTAHTSATDAGRRAPSEELIATLRRRFDARLSTAHSVLLQHGSDESSYRPLPPDAVVYVHSTDEAAFVVRACARERVPVIAFGVETCKNTVSINRDIFQLHQLRTSDTPTSNR